MSPRQPLLTSLSEAASVLPSVSGRFLAVAGLWKSDYCFDFSLNVNTGLGLFDCFFVFFFVIIMYREDCFCVHYVKKKVLFLLAIMSFILWEANIYFLKSEKNKAQMRQDQIKVNNLYPAWPHSLTVANTSDWTELDPDDLLEISSNKSTAINQSINKIKTKFDLTLVKLSVFTNFKHIFKKITKNSERSVYVLLQTSKIKSSHLDELETFSKGMSKHMEPCVSVCARR